MRGRPPGSSILASRPCPEGRCPRALGSSSVSDYCSTLVFNFGFWRFCWEKLPAPRPASQLGLLERERMLASFHPGQGARWAHAGTKHPEFRNTVRIQLRSSVSARHCIHSSPSSWHSLEQWSRLAEGWPSCDCSWPPVPLVLQASASSTQQLVEAFGARSSRYSFA